MRAPPSVVAGQNVRMFGTSSDHAKSAYVCAVWSEHVYKPVTINHDCHQCFEFYLLDCEDTNHEQLTITFIVAWLTVPALKSLNDVENDGESASLSMPSWSKLLHVPCFLQSIWCAASVQRIHIDHVWCTCWTASLFELAYLAHVQFQFSPLICGWVLGVGIRKIYSYVSLLLCMLLYSISKVVASSQHYP